MLIDWIYRKDENYYPNAFRKILFYWRHRNSDEENYDDEYINLFLKSLKKSESTVLFRT